MADPNSKPQVVRGSFNTPPIVVSEPDPYGSQPPRLLVAINDSKAPEPEGVRRVNYIEARARADKARSAPKDAPKYPSKVGAPMATADVPLAHVIHIKGISSALPPAIAKEEWAQTGEQKDGHTAVLEILQWVEERLHDPWDKIWESQGGPAVRWATPPPDAVIENDIDPEADEAWARITTELLLGITYDGPGDSYAMGSAGRATPPSGRWDTYIYQRLEMGYPVESPWINPTNNHLHGAYHVASWTQPYPKPEKPTAQDLKNIGVEKFWSWQVNDDPAAPVVAACQHLATLVSIMRGYPLTWMGTATLGPIGYQASDAVRSYPIFGAPAALTGPNPYGAAREIIEKNTGLAEIDKGKWLPANRDLLPAIVGAGNERKAKWEAIERFKFVPGTIFVWDPDQGYDDLEAFLDSKNQDMMLEGGRKKNQTALTIHMTEFEKLFEERKTFAMFFKSRMASGSSQFGGGDFLLPGARKPDPPNAQQMQSAERTARTNEQHWRGQVEKYRKELDTMPANAWNRKTIDTKHKQAKDSHAYWLDIVNRLPAICANTYTGIPVAYTPQQLPGSHINTVLRTTPDRTALQLMETGFGGHLGILYRTGSEAIVPNGGSFISDSYRHPEAGETISDTNAQSAEASGLQIGEGIGKTFAGIGVPAPLPKSRTLAAQTEHLKKVRPVGLVRFGLTRRVAPLVMDRPRDVLYVSAMRPMYDHEDPYLNYPVSKLLWSLRNTPGFTNVQPWWLVYLPLGLLSRCMYAHGARSMTLRDFVEKFRTSEEDSMTKWFHRYVVDKWPPEDPIAREKARSARLEGKLYDGKHYRLIIMLTNHGSDQPAFAGKAKYHKRFKYVEGNTGRSGDGEYTPNALRAAAASLSWEEHYVHREIDERALLMNLPAFFEHNPPEPYHEEPDDY